MSTPRRFFTQKLNYPEESEVVIDGEEFIHAVKVLRVEEGSEITLLDGSGNEFSAIVSRIEKRALSAHIIGVNAGDREAKTKIYLLCGALKGDKTELVVQKACELGVARVGVFSSEYCSAYMNANKLERLNKVAREAAKQCLRSTAPEIEYFDSLKDALASAQDYKNKLFACEFASESDADMGNLSGSTAIVIGSEGGFSAEEFKMAKEEFNFSGITLGKRILRAETAAISVCAVVAFSLGELR
ncbi:MAG: RsmE family RNA methyltransferase [Candidatus Coproplasma sp.]